MIGHLLNRSVDVYREMTEPDGVGGQTSVRVLVSSALPARVAQPSTSERVVALQEGAEWTVKVYVAPGADVQRGDELRDGAAGEEFRVKSVVRPSAPGVYLRADCEHVQRRAEP